MRAPEHDTAPQLIHLPLFVFIANSVHDYQEQVVRARCGASRALPPH